MMCEYFMIDCIWMKWISSQSIIAIVCIPSKLRYLCFVHVKLIWWDIKPFYHSVSLKHVKTHFLKKQKRGRESEGAWGGEEWMGHHYALRIVFIEVVSGKATWCLSCCPCEWPGKNRGRQSKCLSLSHLWEIWKKLVVLGLTQPCPWCPLGRGSLPGADQPCPLRPCGERITGWSMLSVTINTT